MSKVCYGRISSPFGDRIHPITKKKTFHNGVDIAAPIGSDVLSPFDGEVVAVYTHATGGNTMILRGGNGHRAGFCHLSAQLLKVGARVAKGDKIALSGNTGASTGAHLHYTYATKVDWSSPSGKVLQWENSADYIDIK